MQGTAMDGKSSNMPDDDFANYSQSLGRGSKPNSNTEGPGGPCFTTFRARGKRPSCGVRREKVHHLASIRASAWMGQQGQLDPDGARQEVVGDPAPLQPARTRSNP